MKFKEEVIQNISWMYIYRVVRLPLAFIVTAWLARYLGPDRYGAYVYAVAIPELVMLFWSQGLKEVVIQEIKKSGLNKTQVSMAAFQLMAMGNLVLYGILAAVLLLFIDEQVVIILSLFCGLGILFRAFEGFELWFYASLKVRVTVWVQFITQLIYIALVAGFILYEVSLIWFGLAYAVQLIITGIGFVAVYWGSNKPISFFENLKFQRRQLFNLGKFMILAKLCFTISMLIDRVLLEYLIDVEAVGYYAAAMKMITTGTFISASVSLSFISVINSPASKEERRKNMDTMFGWITSGALLLLIPFLLFSEFLVHLVFGEGYSRSIPLFRILALAMPFFLLNEGVKVWLITHKKTKYYIISMILTATLSIAGNFVLVPLLGIKGAPVAFLTSWMTGSLFVFFGFRETRQLGKQLLKSFSYPLAYFRKRMS